MSNKGIPPFDYLSEAYDHDDIKRALNIDIELRERHRSAKKKTISD